MSHESFSRVRRLSDSLREEAGEIKQRSPSSPEDRKRKNARAQSDFRKRKKDYVDQLEQSIAEAGCHLQHLTALHQTAAGETADLRQQNAQLVEIVASLRRELNEAMGSTNSPTLAPVQQALAVPETSTMPFSSALSLPIASYIIDDFNVYAEADAPTASASFVYAPTHAPYPLDLHNVDAYGPPAMTVSPLSAATEPMPSTPPSSLLDEGQDWFSPDAESDELVLAYSQSLRLDPSNLAQLRASSLPTKSAKCTAQIVQMRKMVSKAEIQRLESLGLVRRMN